MKDRSAASPAKPATKRARSKNPYDRPNLPTEPYSFYFYYFRPSKFGNKPKILFYQSQSNPVAPVLKRIVKEYAECAALGVDVPPPCEPGFDWRKKSYIVIMVDEEGWKFANPAIKFKRDRADRRDPPYLENHTFYHAKHDTVKIHPKNETEREREIFYFINHMLQSATDDSDIFGPRQHFCFELCPTLPRFESMTADGTNLGPPVPPPAVRLIRPHSPGAQKGSASD